MTDEWKTDTFIYHKLTFGSGELKSIIYVKAYVLSMVAKFQLHPGSHMLSEKILF